MKELITYEEMVQQFADAGVRVTSGARRIYVTLNQGQTVDVFSKNGPATVSLVEGVIVVEPQTVH